MAYSGDDLRSLTVDSAATCHYNCREDIDCAGFVFNVSKSADPNCYLKLELTNPTADVRFISGTRFCGVTGELQFFREIYKDCFKPTTVTFN